VGVLAYASVCAYAYACAYALVKTSLNRHYITFCCKKPINTLTGFLIKIDKINLLIREIVFLSKRET